MNNKFLKFVLSAAATVVCAFGLTACETDDGNANKWNDAYSIEAAYAVAQNLGYNGSLEEFIASIGGKDGEKGDKGDDGKDGVGIKKVEINGDGEIVITYTDGETVNAGKIPECKHQYSDWQTIAEATCTSIGYNTRSCYVCGYAEYEFIESAGHNWDEGNNLIDLGLTLYTCKTCHATQMAIYKEPEIKDPKPEDYVLTLPVENVNIIVDYGFRYDEALNIYGNHNAIDFGGTESDGVFAVYEGTVTEIAADKENGENYIIIDHGNGLTSTYKYVNVSSALKVGDAVTKGEEIGNIAPASGIERASGDHLHFEIRVNGKAENPRDWLEMD